MSATAVSSITIRRETRDPLGPIRDALAIAGRNLIALRRVPQLLVFSTIQPVVFVLMFRYVFGGAVAGSLRGIPYVDFLMPGVFVQTVVFGSMNSAVGLATDMQSGLLERFRSLPMARSAVLAGRTLADLARNVFVVALMAAVGFLVGFRVHTSVAPFLAALLLVLAFGYVMSWIFAVPGPGAPGVRLVRLRAGQLDAVVASGLRQQPAGLGDRRRGPGPGAGRSHGLARVGLARVVHGHPAGVHPPGRAAVPPSGVGVESRAKRTLGGLGGMRPAPTLRSPTERGEAEPPTPDPDSGNRAA